MDILGKGGVQQLESAAMMVNTLNHNSTECEKLMKPFTAVFMQVLSPLCYSMPACFILVGSNRQ